MSEQVVSTLVQTLYDANSHVGYRRARRHPSVTPFLFGVKHRGDVIDLDTTATQVEDVIAFLGDLKAQGKKIVVVGTKPELKKQIEDTAHDMIMPYATKRWVGGTLTNFGQIRGRIDMLQDLEQKQASNSLVYRTKKELLMLERKILKLRLTFGGLIRMTSKPAALLVVDPRKEHIAVQEAITLNIPVIAIANTDCDISIIDYPIVANDATVSSVSTVLKMLSEAWDAKKGPEQEAPKVAA
jgi:small subunit ribosomal protein S2